MILKSFAKINLGLRIVGKRSDGFHDLEMLVQSVNLYDLIKISKLSSKKILVNCNKNICDSKSNLAYKAASLILNLTGLDFGVKIEIEKNIPIGAGLGGGSSNAAAVIFGLNKIMKLNLSRREVIKLCSEIGSDVPFCYYGGTMVCCGRGEILKKIYGMPECCILLKYGEDKVCTESAFKQFDDLALDEWVDNTRIKNLKDAILSKDVEKISKSCFNDFEMIQKVPSGWHLTGSGSTAFKIINDNYMIFNRDYTVCRPNEEGVEIIESDWN